MPVATAAPAPQPPTTAARGKSPRFLVALVALAITGTGSLMLVASAMRGPAETTAAPPAAANAATNATAAAPVAVEPNVAPSDRLPAPRWAASRNSRKAGYGANMVFELAADGDIEVWRKRVRPVLTVRCVPGATEVFIVTDSPASIEDNSNRHTVTMSFDGRNAVEQKWEHSIDHDALFAPDGRAMVRRIAAAKELTFSFSPFNAPPATATFSVEGFADQQKAAVRMCGL